MSSRRYLVAGCSALALGGGASTAMASAPGAATAQPPRASLTDFVCKQALDPLTRGIAVKAVMRPVPSTQRMQVKFDVLVARRWSGPFKVAKEKKGSEFGRWISPSPNRNLGQLPTDVWNVPGQAVNLSAPAYYRLRVGFRWLGAGGAKLAQSVRTSAKCWQPEQRPDLVVRPITIQAIPSATPAEDAYIAVIANRGATAAGQFDVTLSEAQTVVDTISVPALGPHQTHRVRFVASACTSGEVITVTADPNHLVDVYDRSKSTYSTTCP